MAKSKTKMPRTKRQQAVVDGRTRVQNILKERGNKYGTFEDNSELTQKVKDIYRAHPGWQKLSYAQREAFDMDIHKKSRIMNGDPNYQDSWTDIVGYNLLVEEKL